MTCKVQTTLNNACIVNCSNFIVWCSNLRVKLQKMWRLLRFVQMPRGWTPAFG